MSRSSFSCARLSVSSPGARPPRGSSSRPTTVCLVCLTDSILGSVRIYKQAQELCENQPKDASLRSFARAQAKCDRLERSATASSVASEILHAKVSTRRVCLVSATELLTRMHGQGDLAGAAASLKQAYRLWTRAAYTLEKMAQATAPDVRASSAPMANPFAVASSDNPVDPANAPAADDLAAPARSQDVLTSHFDGTGSHWRVLRVCLCRPSALLPRLCKADCLWSYQGLAKCLFDLSNATLRRGAAREAQFYLDEALPFVRSSKATAMVVCALVQIADIQLLLGLLKESRGTCVEAAGLITEVSPSLSSGARTVC